MNELKEKLVKFETLLRVQAIKQTMDELEDEFIDSVLDSFGFKPENNDKPSFSSDAVSGK